MTNFLSPTSITALLAVVALVGQTLGHEQHRSTVRNHHYHHPHRIGDGGGRLAFSAPLRDPNSILVAANVTGVARIYDAFDSVAWEAAYGSVELGAGQAAKNFSFSTRFPIGSNTKFMTAIALYQLQESGAVQLNRSISDYLTQSDFAAFGYPNMTEYCPRVPGNETCQVISFQQLLAMSAGIPVNVDEELMPFDGTTASTVGSSIVAPLLFVPGTQYYYSNPSFNLAGYFVEKFSGMLLGDYFERYIFHVVGMTDSYLDVHNGQLSFDPQRTGEYRSFLSNQSGSGAPLLGRGTCATELDLGSVSGAGGVVSTLRDEMRLYYSFFNATAQGRPLLRDPKSWRAVMAPRTLVSAVSNFYYAQGIGVYTSATDPLTVDYVAYMGGLLCVQTANFMDLTVSPPRMAQVFSNSVVYYVDPAAYHAWVASPVGSVFQFTDMLSEATSPFLLAQEILFASK